MEPYNAVFSLAGMTDHADACFYYDNAALYNYCKRRLDIAQPSLHDLNR